MTIDPRYKRIAKRLRIFELVGGDEVELDLGLGPDREREPTRFLDFYSRDGLGRALVAYGVHDALVRLGLGEYEVVVGGDDPYRHRAQVLLGGIADDEHRLVDLVACTSPVRESALTSDATSETCYGMLLVEWLCLQNPRAEFTPERPRLPGQRHPGLGLGYAFHNITLLIAQRLGLDGVLNVPGHYHLAQIYHRVGYHFVCADHHSEVEAVARATRSLHFASAAWAAERGFIRMAGTDGDADVDQVWSYTPAEMVAPVSQRLETCLRARCGLLDRLLERLSRPVADVDLDGLRRSLVEDPVEGIDLQQVPAPAASRTSL